jgi:hypothetical protein
MKQVRGGDGVEEAANVERGRRIPILPTDTNEEEGEEVNKSNVVRHIIMKPPKDNKFAVRL